MAIAWLMQAASSRPDRPEAHSRMEALRVELMKNLPPSTIPNAPPAPPPTPAGTAAAPAADLAAIPGGPFTMGASAPGGSPDEYPAHKVILPPFSLETREVTVESYRKFCAETGRKPPPQPGWSSPQHPVVSVTWRDAQDYCRRKGRRLPTEAEWERAARCGAALRYANGDSPQSINPYAWSVENSGGRAHAVATRLPGSCSLLDAYGNVWEWTADWYSANYYDNSPERDPRGPRYGEEKVLRGGAFDSPLAALGATFRDKFSPDYGAENRGFRCARSQPR
jgi:formylglycine-generating enzyme required for sulfatase activity